MKNIQKIDICKKALKDLNKNLAKCFLCNRKCGVNRSNDEKGFCFANNKMIIYNYFPHLGEEPVISGGKGSGTIFFSLCSMKCVYCQNHKFSQASVGKIVTEKELAEIILSLQAKGCHNINLVNPTHYVPQIVSALSIAYSKGLNLPIVYNTGGYDSLETIEALRGIVDIYLPDMKYSDNSMALRYSNADKYVENNIRIVKEMYKQVGHLKIYRGIAEKGIIIRLLILPNNVAGINATLDNITKIFSEDIFISIMSQYYPTFRAKEYSAISNKISRQEYQIVCDYIDNSQIKNGWIFCLTKINAIM